ncbi:hypothetical protein [Pseudonocardia sp. GCM10023141]|uniref:hypothetical protein n=1 Tax=Pseudonocardia sp. GCM10023141 TaxID=3252653 RepID=UPI00360CCD30
MMRRLITLLCATAAVLIMAPAASAAAETAAVDETNGGFYCSAATTSVPCRPCRPDKGEPDCRPQTFIRAVRTTVFASIDNQAAGGEVCRLHVDRMGYFPDVVFPAGDYGARKMGTVPANTVFTINCMRRAASGDAVIGGYIGTGD